MADSPRDDDRQARLRLAAEALLAEAPAAADGTLLSPVDMARLIHELRVSQVELELQNEELRRTQAELAETRDRYADLYDFAPVGYFTLDARGVILQANRKGAVILGQDRTRLVGKPFLVFVARSDQAAFHAGLARLFESSRPGSLDLRLTRRDGSRFFAEITAEPRPAIVATATPASLRMTVTDVTSRHESDEALRLAGLIVEASPAYLIRYPVVDGEPGPVEYVSSNIKRFGFSREDLLAGAVSPRDLVHPDDLDRVEQTLRHNAATGCDVFSLDYRLRPRDGQVRHVTDRIQLLRDAKGRVNAVQGLTLDVTEERLARRDLETVLDSAPIPIVKVRVMEDGDRVLDYQNPAAAALFGPDALGRSCKPYLCNKEACPALRADSGLVRDRECAIKTLSGERIMYKTAAKLPDAPCIIEAMVDVTELMRTRERLTRAMEGAEAANRAKSEFLATMSHEIRTPINGIMGMTELALQTELSDEQREYLDLARQSALALLDIINDILDFSRIEAGRMEMVREPFSLSQTLTRCLRLFTPQASRQCDELALTLAPDVPDSLIGDAGRLFQVLANLVSNGIKFTRNGFVRLAVETSPPLQCPLGKTFERPLTLLFAVSDNGPGIPTDKQERIFDPFTQLDGSLTRGAGGTGLGLSICKSLVGLMDGRLWVESTPGAGSTFFFTALFDQPQEATRLLVPEPDDAFAREPAPLALNILLVEDNCINQLVAKRLLERRGHLVTAVDSGLAALELLRQYAYDCVLMDVEMPGLNGLETLARLRDASVYGPAAALPVVALTAHAVKGYRERMLAAGFDDYVSKPIDMRELAAALARAAAKRGAPPPAGQASAAGRA
ncbi:MAG: response regulator [Solidesulfovibrio sp. DCME]|uniref:response regulator n=1 Tax=Solidesulfovibrio sp. DCME TaxID=3447380 RepID=UPI003D0B6761